VGKELLEDEGAAVTLADNGVLGVVAVAAADPPFDAVLMDLQMPGLDGYTATAQIRHRLGLALLPIIVMTANAMASDRQACLAAGMNDHVGNAGPARLGRLERAAAPRCGDAGTRGLNLMLHSATNLRTGAQRLPRLGRLGSWSVPVHRTGAGLAHAARARAVRPIGQQHGQPRLRSRAEGFRRCCVDARTCSDALRCGE